jgi:perosamine synthetase
MENRIPLFKIYWDEDDLKLVNETIRRGAYWTIGSNTTTFEEMISKYFGAKYCLTLNSGTSALHCVLLAYGLGPGDEVIVPSFTFIATANAALFVGAKPVFADIELQTYALDPDDVLRKITPRTKAIIPVHYAGSPCLVKELKQIADEHGLLLIEDAAEAFGASIGKQKVGTFGSSSILSFCQNKIIATGEGGAIITDSKDIYEKIKLIRSQGRLETADYFTSSEYMDYVTLGYNFRLSDISAALGIAQMKKVDKIIEMRRRNAAYWDKKLASVRQLIVPQNPEDYFNVYQMYRVFVKSGQPTRDKLVTFLGTKGITVKVNFYPVHLTKLYRERFGHHRGELPKTETASEQVITLPMYPSLSEDQIDYIVAQIVDFFNLHNDQAT